MADTLIKPPTLGTIPARGKISSTAGGVVKFAPSNTNYVLHLAGRDDSAAPLNTLLDGMIRVVARKVYTVSSGGNFISPIFGPPRIIQGRVRALEGRSMVVQAGVPVQVELPAEASAVELANGPITVGSLVNVVARPGATFELAK